MIRPRETCWLLAVGIWLGSAIVYGEEPAETPKPAVAAPSSEQVAQWIVELDADKFDVREKATQALSAAGKPVIEPLLEAAEDGSLEVAMRAVAILTKLLAGEDESTSEAAGEALAKLAEAENAAVAARAKATLAMQEAAQRAQQGPAIQIGGGGGGIIIAGGNGGAVVQMNGGGVRTAVVHENGKTITIHEDKKGVQVSVTERKKGEDITTTYKAKDAVELKKKHPEAHKLYAEHLPGQPQGGLVIRGNVVIKGGIQAAPAEAPAVDAAKAGERVASAKKRLADAKDSLRKQIDSGTVTADVLKQALDQIERAVKELAEAEEQLKP